MAFMWAEEEVPRQSWDMFPTLIINESQPDALHIYMVGMQRVAM